MLEIAKADILARLAFDNPWWGEGREGKIAYQDSPRRKYFDVFLRGITDRRLHRATVLMGPRRVGKTVMVYHAVRALLDAEVPSCNIMYLSLETPIFTGLSLEKLLGLFQERFMHARDAALTVFFDEIQYLKNWEVHLKSLVDSYPDYKFVVTGSAAAALRLKSSESGAGRFSDFVLPPLTFAEYLTFIGRESELINSAAATLAPQPFWKEYVATDIDELNAEFIRYLNYGGYPEAVFSDAVRSDPGQYIKSDIIDKVLLRDLPSLYGISDIQELNRLFTVLAYNTGNEVSLEGLAQSSGVAKNTLKRYLEYLEAAFLIRRVERIDQNARRFKRAMYFKVYLTNPSMRAALFGQLSPDASAMGALTETAIYSQWQHSQIAELYYARWGSGEVDIVHMSGIEQKPSWVVEVKWSDRPYATHSELSNCVEFATKNSSVKQPILVTTKTQTGEVKGYLGVDFVFRPSAVYAYALGANILQWIEEKRQAALSHVK
jgi:uncharacterized protein